MKYGVWFVRLIFAAWMVPAGLNHFIPLFPQPLGSQHLSKELFSALWDSSLFDYVKLVELLTGLGVITGFYLPMALVIGMPVSFCVWYWDTVLEGGTAAYFGGAVLLCNVLLCLAYFGTYRSMFALRSTPKPLGSKQVVLAGRIIFGAWMLIAGINHFFGPFYAEPTGTEPLAAQLMTGVVDSHLIDVVIGIQLVGGALVLIGVFVPVALCVMIPTLVCAAYWAVILEHQAVGAIVALVAVALNALLMLAYIDYYKGVLQRRALAVGEA